MRSGNEYLRSIKNDGRQVYIDATCVGDVTEHPAFKEATRSIARLFDVIADPANRELLTYTSPKTGAPVNRAYMIPRSREDLTARRKALWRLSEESFGFMGRTPEHVAAFFAAFAGAPSTWAKTDQRYYRNVVAFYERMRDESLYVAYTIVPPQIDRSKPAHKQEDPTLYAGVVGETADGIIIKGAQMLGTGAAIPCNAPGVKIYSRRSYAEGATSMFDYPLASRFDETDSLLVYEDVFVPWEHVFIYKDLALTRASFFETSAHLLGNNQAQIRFAVKMKFLAGLVRAVAETTGSIAIPPVQSALGDIAALAALVEGLVLAQEAHCTIDADGVARPGAQEQYSQMVLQPELHNRVIAAIRDLVGGGVIQLPSSVEDFTNPGMAADINRYIQSPGTPALKRVKLMKLVWDAIGSEFAGRHAQYEMFYAGAPFVTKGHMYRNYDFAGAGALVQRALDGYDATGRVPA